MKIDFSKPLSIGETPVKFEKDKQANLGDACRLILNAAPSADRSRPIEEMLKRGRLSLKIAEGGNIELTPEEASLIRQIIPQGISHPELAVFIYDMLDPASDQSSDP